MRMLDLFAGRLGWAIPFLERGWYVVAVDLVEPPNLAELLAKYPRLTFVKMNVLDIIASHIFESRFLTIKGDNPNPFWEGFDFICASSPCEQFSVHGMKHFHPNPPYPELGIKLFEHTRALCEASGVPYCMENVRAAQKFVGNAVHHCGPFYLWGSGVPAVLGQGISKAKWKPNVEHGRRAPGNFAAELKLPKSQRKPLLATIPPELSSCVCAYAERLMEMKV